VVAVVAATTPALAAPAALGECLVAAVAVAAVARRPAATAALALMALCSCGLGDMSRIALSGGAYQARSVIASAQRMLNLYAEPLPDIQGEPARFAYYPTPGLRLLNTLPEAPVRGIRQATNGNVYAVAGRGVYRVNADWSGTHLGDITLGPTNPVSMADNGIELVVVDGTALGWKVTLSTDAFAQISDPTGSFAGGDRVDFLDTYLLFNVPGTPQFESSDSLATTFDPLWFANKEAYGDNLVTLMVAKRNIWLLGERTTEIFFNSGKPDFPFESWPNVLIDHGCAAKYSVAQIDNSVFWLSQDRQGEGIVLKGAGTEVTRISTFAIEAEIAGYATISDAIGYSYQFAGHGFYVLTFPTVSKTWAFDISTGLWSELAWIDTNGREHRHRGNCAWLCRGQIVLGDWQNGNLYALDPSVYTDFDGPVKRVRAFPHLLADGRRVYYRQVLLDVEVGNEPATPSGLTLPTVWLDWSDDRGRSYGNPISQDIGGVGEYRTSVQFQRLGMARDRVFRVSWSSPTRTALQGAWVDASPAES
jgi:hypothetical protein